MGNEASESNSKSKSNSTKSDSRYCNSAEDKGDFETMNCLTDNRNTIIKRVWIVKRSISLSDKHISIPMSCFLGSKTNSYINLFKHEENVFERKDEIKSSPKHWAIILELSNETYVNIQFGRKGFSLKEFNKTNIEGENIFNSIIETWGEYNDPFSFCYLGEANYEYNILIQYLENRKNEEIEMFNEKGFTYYNLITYNCQHFVCDIEKVLFGHIKMFHSFNYYVNQFYSHFFPHIHLDRLKEKYTNYINTKNEEISKINKEEFKYKAKVGAFDFFFGNFIPFNYLIPPKIKEEYVNKVINKIHDK